MSAKTAVFLDRDGVIIEEVNYLSRPEQVCLISGSAEAIARLNQLGIPVIVVSNQAGVARGFFSEADINLVHRQVESELAKHQARLDGFYYCPHHPAGSVPEYSHTCQCRKPQTGMLLQAQGDCNLQLAGSWMIGDNITDIEAGLASGCKTILVRTGHGHRFEDRVPKGTLVVDDLNSAVEFLAQAEFSPGTRPA